MIDLAKLKALAEAATPGPWTFENNDRDVVQILDSTNDSILGDADYYPWVPNRETIEYIAAANPATVLALVAEVERLRDALEKYSEEVAYLDKRGLIGEGDNG